MFLKSPIHRVAVLSLSLGLWLCSTAIAQPKLPEAAQSTIQATIEAIKLIEGYENALQSTKQKPNPEQAAKQVAEAVKKASTLLAQYIPKVPADKTGHVTTAKTRLEWVSGIMERDKMTRRAHAMEYLQEAVFQVFLSGLKISPL